MAKRDLKLNSIRYVKESSRLVLEEHSHCEVPAGCGGVVLRWRKHSQLPIQMWLYSRTQTSFYLDGDAMTSSRPLLEPGDHALAFRIFGLDPGHAVLMFAGVYDENEFIHMKIFPPSGQTPRLLSLADGTWKYSTDDPLDDSWMRPGYNDALWRPMIANDFPKPDENDRAGYRIEKITEFGGKGLGIDQPAENVLVRKAFTLSTV